MLERVVIESRSEGIGARAFREWVQERQDFSPGDWGPGQIENEGTALALPYPLARDQVLLSRPDPLVLSAPLKSHSKLKSKTTHPANLSADVIREAWAKAHGNLALAARYLGVHRATLYRYMKKLGLSRSSLDT